MFFLLNYHKIYVTRDNYFENGKLICMIVLIIIFKKMCKCFLKSLCKSLKLVDVAQVEGLM